MSYNCGDGTMTGLESGRKEMEARCAYGGSSCWDGWITL